MTPAPAALDALLQRRSVSPRRLGGPGPSADDWKAALAAALRAPDHGGLVPWRLIEFPFAQRHPLAALFADEKRRRDPLASADDLERARSHALQPSGLIAFVVSPRRTSTVPLHEQWLAAGAALANLLNALQALGHGAIILSGDRCADRTLCQAVGIASDETLAGFISAGTVVKVPSAATPKPQHDLLRTWAGHGSVPADRHGADQSCGEQPSSHESAAPVAVDDQAPNLGAPSATHP